MLAPFPMYGSETMIWKKKGCTDEKIRGFLGIRGMDRVPNARIRELCGVKKDLDESIDEGVLRWFGHVERMEREIGLPRESM